MTEKPFWRKAFVSGALVIVGSLMLLPLMLVKVFEGGYFCVTLTANSVRQVWADKSGKDA